MTQQLVAIYDALSTIKTAGQETLVMADCLRALAQVIEVMNTSEQEGRLAPEKDEGDE